MVYRFFKEIGEGAGLGWYLSVAESFKHVPLMLQFENCNLKQNCYTINFRIIAVHKVEITMSYLSSVCAFISSVILTTFLSFFYFVLL